MIRWALVSSVVLGGVLNLGYAAAPITGQWQTQDDKTRQPNSVITIWQSNGKYFGKVSKIYPVDGAKTTDICVKCTGARHNKPMLGLVIIQNMVEKGEKYMGGTILDPRNGKIYRCTLKAGTAGDTLIVRGYLGMSIFGQSRVWHKI